jgi:hypothetical protein
MGMAKILGSLKLELSAVSDMPKSFFLRILSGVIIIKTTKFTIKYISKIESNSIYG